MLGPVWTGYSLSHLCRRQVVLGTAPHSGEVSWRDGLAPAPALLSSPRRVGPGGSHPPRTNPASEQPALPFPPSPAATPLHTPPQVRPTAATLPAPLTDFMAEAMSSYLSACSARRALCSSCSRSPMAASVVAAGLGRESGRRAGMCGWARTGGGSRNCKRSRPLGCAGLSCAGLGCAGRRSLARRPRSRTDRGVCGSEPGAAAAARACAPGRQRGGGAAVLQGRGGGAAPPRSISR